jgi:hypothetical protein
MFRVTRKGGVVIFDTLNKDFIWERIKSLFGIQTEGIYKTKISIPKGEEYKIEKLNDFHLPDKLYLFFKIINKCRKILPKCFFHMIYYRIRK